MSTPSGSLAMDGSTAAIASSAPGFAPMLRPWSMATMYDPSGVGVEQHLRAQLDSVHTLHLSWCGAQVTIFSMTRMMVLTGGWPTPAGGCGYRRGHGTAS
jgi:hypothetical protein